MNPNKATYIKNQNTYPNVFTRRTFNYLDGFDNEVMLSYVDKHYNKAVPTPEQIVALKAPRVNQTQHYLSHCGELCRVVAREVPSKQYLLVEFPSDGTVLRVHQSRAKAGNFSHPTKPTVYGVGYLGIQEQGDPRPSNAIKTVWKNLCYFHSIGRSVLCDEWKDLQAFTRWYSPRIRALKAVYPQVKFSLETDLMMVAQGNKDKIYSPATVILLPQTTNTVITAYLDTHKHIQDLLNGVVCKMPKGAFLDRKNNRIQILMQGKVLESFPLTREGFLRSMETLSRVRLQRVIDTFAPYRKHLAQDVLPWVYEMHGKLFGEVL